VYYEKTAFGFYRKGYLRLINKELYMYSDMDSTLKEEALIILSPGVFIKTVKHFQIEPGMIETHKKIKYVMYPIEL